MKTAAAILLSFGLTLCAAQNIPLPVIRAAASKISAHSNGNVTAFDARIEGLD